MPRVAQLRRPEQPGGERDVDPLGCEPLLELGARELVLPGGERRLDGLAHRVERHAALAVAHFAQGELQRAAGGRDSGRGPPRAPTASLPLLRRRVPPARGRRDPRWRPYPTVSPPFAGTGTGARRPGSCCGGDDALLARRRPGDEPGLRKGEDARSRHRRRYYPAMSEYDAWAPVYDEWASDMTEDVAHYVSLAREADGPIVELMVGTGRVAIEVVRETGKPVLGIDSSPAMLEIARERVGGPAARTAARRCARTRARRAGGADLRPVPLAPAPARLAREAASVRARRGLAASRRSIRLQRLRLQPHDCGAARRDDAEPERRRAHASLFPGRQPHRDRAGRRRDDPDLVGDEGRVGRSDRRRRARGRGALRLVRPASRSTTSRSSSSTWLASPERLRPHRPALRPVERERRRGRLLLRRRGARGRRRARGARRRERDGSRFRPRWPVRT